MNYIFLDIDGVLNNKKHYSKQHKKYGGRFCCENMPFNPRSILNLRKIIDKTNSKVVISSSWRRTKNGMIVLKARLIEYGIHLLAGDRGKEILQWCKDNTKDGDRILIIDDELYDIKEYFSDNKIVKVNYNDGLNKIKRYEAIRKLSKNGGKLWMM